MTSTKTATFRSFPQYSSFYNYEPRKFSSLHYSECSEWPHIVPELQQLLVSESDCIPAALWMPLSNSGVIQTQWFCLYTLNIGCNVGCSYILTFFTAKDDALTLLVGRQKRPVNSWVLVCWWWWFDWSFARFIAPVVTNNSIILCFSKHRLTQVHLEKLPLKRREKENE